MAWVRWLLLAGVTVLAATTVWQEWGPGHGHDAHADEARFYCPMHPQIRSSAPGECPICHMRLEPIPRERRQPAARSARSPRPAPRPAPRGPDAHQHERGHTDSARTLRAPSPGEGPAPSPARTPDALSASPSGQRPPAPSTGPASTEASGAARDTSGGTVEMPSGASPGATVYTCSMHPQVRSNAPGRCPICNMFLEPVAGEVAVPSAPPPGLVEVMITLERRQESGIVTVPVTRTAGATTLRSPAIVEVREDAVSEVHVRTMSFIEQVLVRSTGVRVRRGQTLAWVYSPEIEQARQELAAATRWGAGGSPGVAPDPILPPSGLHEADSGAAAAGSTITMPRLDLGRMARERLQRLGLSPGDVRALGAGRGAGRVPVRAPRSGTVLRRTAVPGGLAMPETVLYEIADLSRVWVIASVLDRDVARVVASRRATFAPRDGSPAVPATVELVEPRTDDLTRTTRVRIAIDNPNGALRPGQLGDVVFELAPVAALTVPRDALMDTGEHRYVFVEHADGVFEPRTVRTGALVDDRWEILEGLSQSDRVAARGAFLLDAESRLAAALAETRGASPETP